MVIACLVSSRAALAAETPVAPPPLPSVQADLEFLASDALRGRGSATDDELVAATYVAARMRALGVPPAGDAGGYLQAIQVRQPAVTAATLSLPAGKNAQPVSFSHGKDVLFLAGSEIPAEGPLVRVDKGQESTVPKGAVAFVTPDAFARGVAGRLRRAGAVAVLLADAPARAELWSDRAGEPLSLPPRREGTPARPGHVLLLSAEATRSVESLPAGARVRVEVTTREGAPRRTWNALGRIPAQSRGNERNAPESIVLSAHLDHLGAKVPAEAGADAIYNGADDDASGVAAVLALAETLVARPGRREVLLAFFGSEELGGIGSEHFVEFPPAPRDLIVAALQFEMIGRPDPMLGAGRLWFTGYDRSDLGPELARQGAPLVADPRPDQGFYERSDNYRLAQAGVVAHTVSSFGLHDDYHQPDDEVERIDFEHMRAAVRAMVPAVRFLVDGTFKPRFAPGRQP
jgi:aminopeptidase YwaD